LRVLEFFSALVASSIGIKPYQLANLLTLIQIA
jgi:hypothetical protein